MTQNRFPGVLSPVVTPFDADLAPDGARLLDQCRWLLGQQVGLAVFGTNSEANSLSVDEKIHLLDELLDGGVDPQWLLPGTGCCALPDSVALTRHAVSRGCAGVLMLPPFYYKGVSDEGLYASFSEVIQRVGDPNLRILLYHIPPVAQVGLSLELIERLLKAYPGIIAGIKDSGGDWRHTAAMLERRWDGFRVYAGSEAFLLQTMRAGGAGCISATANINPAAIARLQQNSEAPDADAQQSALNSVRDIVSRYPMIPALKAIIAGARNDPTWNRVRPPLVALSASQNRELQTELKSMGFSLGV